MQKLPIEDFVGMGEWQAQLFKVNDYVGAIASENPDDYVIGELYEVTEEQLAELDEYEECSENFPEPREYIRKIVSIDTETGSVKAWVYEYNGAVL